MHTLIISGSSNPDGQTARATDALLQGIVNQGSQAEQVFLSQLNIEQCRQCEDEDGWGIRLHCLTEGQCRIEDDFAPLVDKIKNADAVVFATPVYFGDLSENMRTFLDRLRRICMHETDQPGIREKVAIGICVAGGGGAGGPWCTVILEKILQTCGFDVVDLIPVRRQNLNMKCRVLKVTGEWLSSLDGYTIT